MIIFINYFRDRKSKNKMLHKDCFGRIVKTRMGDGNFYLLKFERNTIYRRSRKCTLDSEVRLP